MKPRESLMSLKRFDAEEKARRVADMEAIIREFEMMVDDLSRQINSEEDRTGVKDLTHFAYSTFAKAAAQRREKLLISVEDLRLKLEAALSERDVAMENLRKLSSNDSRETGRSRRRSDSGSALVG